MHQHRLKIFRFRSRDRPDKPGFAHNRIAGEFSAITELKDLIAIIAEPEEMLLWTSNASNFAVKIIEAADAAVKAAKVQLVELRLAMALGGKAFFSVTGDVAAVTSAVEAGARVVAEKGLLVNKVVIANPRQELLSEMI